MTEKSKSESIIFETEDGTRAEFEVAAQTTLGGVNYLLVIDTEDGESFLVLRENKGAETDGMAAYDVIENEEELEAVIKIFDELLEDVDLEV